MSFKAVETVTIAAYWWAGKSNFGDQLTPYLLQKMADRPTAWTQTVSPRLLSLGSILDQARPHDIVWGSGIQSEGVALADDLDIRMVRGPITWEHLKHQYPKTPKIFGDPALLINEFYEPHISRQPGVTVIPHYRDKYSYHGDRTLDITMHPLKMIDEIVSSDLIVTSALHPLIIAEVYDVPVVAVRNESNKNWSGAQALKFRDYFASTGRDDCSLIEPTLEECLQKIKTMPKPVFPDRKQMREAFPWDRLEDLSVQVSS